MHTPHLQLHLHNIQPYRQTDRQTDRQTNSTQTILQQLVCEDTSHNHTTPASKKHIPKCSESQSKAEQTLNKHSFAYDNINAIEYHIVIPIHTQTNRTGIMHTPHATRTTHTTKTSRPNMQTTNIQAINTTQPATAIHCEYNIRPTANTAAIWASRKPPTNKLKRSTRPRTQQERTSPHCRQQHTTQTATAKQSNKTVSSKTPSTDLDTSGSILQSHAQELRLDQATEIEKGWQHPEVFPGGPPPQY